MRPAKVVETLPFVEFGLQIDVAFVAEELVAFLLIRSVRTFHLAVQLRRAALDVGMADALVVVLSGLVEITADLFDGVDLGQVRAWSQLVRPGCSTNEAMVIALLWLLATPGMIMPKLTPEEEAAEAERREIVRKGRENVRKRRLSYAGA